MNEPIDEKVMTYASAAMVVTATLALINLACVVAYKLWVLAL